MEGIVMKNIEQRAKEWVKHITKSRPYIRIFGGVYRTDEVSGLADIMEESYIKGATDQKAIEEEVTLTKYDSMTGKQLDREECFTSWYFQNAKGAPTFSDAIEWARKEMLDEVCNWLKAHIMFLSDEPMNILLRGLRKEFEK